jgi:hypothetical protein
MKPILNDYKLKRCRRRYELMYNIITGKSIDTLQDKYKQDSDDYFLNFALNVEQGTDEWKLIRAWTICKIYLYSNIIVIFIYPQFYIVFYIS